jgi:hypothetical protein
MDHRPQDHGLNLKPDEQQRNQDTKLRPEGGERISEVSGQQSVVHGPVVLVQLFSFVFCALCVFARDLFVCLVYFVVKILRVSCAFARTGSPCFSFLLSAFPISDF